MVKTNKDNAKAFLKCFENGDKKFIEDNVAENYTPHYPSIKTGRNALLDFFDEMQNMEIKVDIKRVIEDGDYVMLHSEFTGPSVVFDILRFENGKIVDHWANVQEKVDTVSGHTMTDGSTGVMDQEKTVNNKARLKELVEDIFIGGDYEKMSSFFDDDRYIQHNPLFLDGLSGLLKGLEKLEKNGKPMKFIKNHMILGEGNFVLSVSEGIWNNEPGAFYDLFRMENDKFVEHWDVIEPFTKDKDWKNQNGKF